MVSDRGAQSAGNDALETFTVSLPCAALVEFSEELLAPLDEDRSARASREPTANLLGVLTGQHAGA
jgi:hypothetical protein